MVNLVILLLSMSCSTSRELSRSAAATAISTQAEFSHEETEIRLRDQAREEIKKRGGPHNPTWSGFIMSIDGNSAKLAKPTHRTILQVTGISDVPFGEGFKTAEFEWEYDGVPDNLKRLLATKGTGEANFKRYDDGWRVEHLSFNQDTQHLPVNTAESALIATDIERATAEHQRILAESQKSTRELIRFSYISGYKKAERPPNVTFFLSAPVPVTSEDGIVTDVNITRGQSTVWFGNLYKVNAFLDKNEYGLGLWGEKNATQNIHFVDLAERDKALQAVTAALKAWQDKYSGPLGDR
jgi:hypothetical protein